MQSRVVGADFTCEPEICVSFTSGLASGGREVKGLAVRRISVSHQIPFSEGGLTFELDVTVDDEARLHPLDCAEKFPPYRCKGDSLS
jgi:hypothetical protein